MSRWPAKEAMQERILDTAGRLFYGQGIRAVGVDTIAATIEYVDRFVSRGRTPADDRLDAWRASGALLPDAEPVRART